MENESKLDITSIKNALAAFERISIAYQAAVQKQGPERMSDDIIEGLRAGLIQAFEFTYELCWKFMKRWLEYNVSREAVDGIPRRELFRLAAENALITDVKKWFGFHDDRNRTSHIYDEAIAVEVHESAIAFLPYARDFLERLEERL
ncbi:nucleotidyltransferase [Spirochaetia bacterium]|nr:nucleotidyltransferase [Spirochaetia bacterium]